jgi:hypothetical protein
LSFSKLFELGKQENGAGFSPVFGNHVTVEGAEKPEYNEPFIYDGGYYSFFTPAL